MSALFSPRGHGGGTRRVDVERDRMAEFALEVVHSKDTVDVPGIVSEKDTTEGSETAEHVAPGCDGRLNPRDVARHCGICSRVDLAIRRSG